jgi:hypothetical protein
MRPVRPKVLVPVRWTKRQRADGILRAAQRSSLLKECPVRSHLSVYDCQVVRRRCAQDAKKVADLLVWYLHEATAQLAALERIAEDRTVACIGYGQVLEDVTHVGDYHTAGQEDIAPGMWEEPCTVLPEGSHHRRVGAPSGQRASAWRSLVRLRASAVQVIGTMGGLPGDICGHTKHTGHQVAQGAPWSHTVGAIPMPLAMAVWQPESSSHGQDRG